MGKESEEKHLLECGNENGEAMLPVPASFFQPGAIWKMMGFVWRFPNWHGTWLRSEKKGLLTYRKVDAGQPETVLAACTLDELRGLIVSIINCGRLHRTNAVESMSGYRKLCLVVQAVFGTNKRSLALHDRVSMMPSMSGLLEHDCVICAMFHAFRYLVLTRTLDGQCGTPNDWEVLLTEGGNTALLALLRQLENVGAEKGIGIIHADDLRRFPAFVSGLMRIAAPAGANADTLAIASALPSLELAKNADSADKGLTVNLAVYNQIPVNVSQRQEATANGGTATVNVNDSRDGLNQTRKSEDAAGGDTANTAAAYSQGDTAGTRKPEGDAEADTTNTAAVDSQGDTTEAREPEGAAEGGATNTAAADSQGDTTEARKPEDEAEGEAGDIAADDSAATGTDTNRKRHQGFRTTATMQYYALRVLFDLYCGDPEATIRADELCRRILTIQNAAKKVIALDEQYCHSAINDLRKRFRHEGLEAQISKGKYRLVLGHYGRKTEVEKMLDSLKNAAGI